MKKLFFTIFFLFSACQTCADFSRYAQEAKTILQKLRNNESLAGYKIYVLSWKKSSDHDTPPLDVQPWDKRKKGTWGSGDEFMFKPLLYDKLTSLGATVRLALPQYLVPFFKTCSPLGSVVHGFGIDDHKLLSEEYIPMEGRDLLDNIRAIELLEPTTKFFGTGCPDWVLHDVQQIKNNVMQLLKKGITPVLFNRTSARLNEKFSQNLRGYKKYHYLSHRVIPYETYRELLARKPETVHMYNVTFDDRNKPIEPGASDPTQLYKNYRVKRPPFINDGILMAGVLTAVLELPSGKKRSGHIMSVETGLICMSMELAGLHADNWNIHLLLTEIYNGRWTSGYRRENGNLCWGPVNMIVQNHFGNWSDALDRILEMFSSF